MEDISAPRFVNFVATVLFGLTTGTDERTLPDTNSLSESAPPHIKAISSTTQIAQNVLFAVTYPLESLLVMSETSSAFSALLNLCVLFFQRCHY